MYLIRIRIIQLYLLNIPFSLGTETVITTFKLLSSSYDFIEIEWNQPMYTPISMEMEVKCRVFCDEQWYLRTSFMLMPALTRLKVKTLKPGSICLFTTLVLYNPARYDRGLKRHYVTLQSSKIKH